MSFQAIPGRKHDAAQWADARQREALQAIFARQGRRPVVL
jgi:hypothetical protein